MTSPLLNLVAGVPYFATTIANPMDVLDVMHDGRPPIAPAGEAFLVHGAGRTGYGFSRMAARAPGNEDSLVMVLPDEVQEWYRLRVLNSNARYLADGIVFNPPGEKEVSVLPPRHVKEKVEALELMARRNNKLEPVLMWAREQIADERTKRVTEYWMKAAQVQAVTTRVADMPSVVNEELIRGFHPDVKYAVLHPSKSIVAPRKEGENPLFGHELLQALLTEGGRGDLSGWVVASGGYWVDSTIANRGKVRLLFSSSESTEAVDAVKRSVGGTVRSYDLVSIASAVGRAAVFGVQFGGWIKNLLANMLGEESARTAMGLGDSQPNYGQLQTWSDTRRHELIGKAEELASRAMVTEGLADPGVQVRFPNEVIEDIIACTVLNWPALISEVNSLKMIAAGQRVAGGHLPFEARDAIRAGLNTLVNSSSEVHFGSTNMSVAIAYGLARVFAEQRMVSSYRDVFDRQAVGVPEGIRSMPHVRDRFSKAGLPRGFVKAIKRFDALMSP